MMKILVSRRFRLIKYVLALTTFFMILNLRSNYQMESRTKRSGDQLTNESPDLPKDLPNIDTTNSVFFETKSPAGLKHLKDKIAKANAAQHIHNFHLLKKLIESETSKKPLEVEELNSVKYQPPSTKFLVILIQIHSRISYLKELIESLRATKHIEDTLVIFSHDIYIEEMNDLIGEIDFCATLQIFYPYSLQIYGNEFPGRDPNDCKQTFTKVQAIKARCNNAYHADSFGHYREHNIVQIKHHWFWKMSYVFEKLNATGELNDLQVLLLEEDHYLMPDAIHILRKLSEKILSDIDVVSLGFINKLVQDLNFSEKTLNKVSVVHKWPNLFWSVLSICV